MRLKKYGRRLIYLSIFVAILPLISVAIAYGMAYDLHCTINEAGASGCMIQGIDVSNYLYTMFVSGWYVYYTAPVGAAGILLGLMVWVVGRFMQHRLEKKPRRPTPPWPGPQSGQRPPASPQNFTAGPGQF